MKKKTWLYEIFGVYILSNLKCSCLQAKRMSKSSPRIVSVNILSAKDISDKRFKRDISKDPQKDFLITNAYAVLYDSEFRILVENTDLITIAIKEDTTVDLVIKYMLETAVLFYWTTKGAVFFHGSSVTVDDNKGIVFIGDSGVGKSTLSAYFDTLGYAKTSDDICVISFMDEVPYIIPSAGSQRLNEESLKLLGYRPFRRKYNKLADKYELKINANRPFDQDLVRLHKMYFLEKNKRLKHISVKTLNNLQKVKLLLKHQIRNKHHELFLKRIISLARHVEIKNIQRPLTGNTLKNIADKVLTIEKQNI